ncbi:hypothetical protein [uncultured Methanoregula sp.]|uniref:hypothetical protein n=1 Tax=uncultured Methanoregula sp. TaxID=1005933 RepID=UPI003749395F
MVRGFSMTNVSGFWEIAFGLGILLVGSFIWNLNHGGVVNAIISLSTSLFGIVIDIVIIGIIFVKVYHFVYPYRMFIE